MKAIIGKRLFLNLHTRVQDCNKLFSKDTKVEVLKTFLSRLFVVIPNGKNFWSQSRSKDRSAIFSTSTFPEQNQGFLLSLFWIRSGCSVQVDLPSSKSGQTPTSSGNGLRRQRPQKATASKGNRSKFVVIFGFVSNHQVEVVLQSKSVQSGTVFYSSVWLILLKYFADLKFVSLVLSSRTLIGSFWPLFSTIIFPENLSPHL